jgi:anti-sigma factor RsiW
VGPHVSDDSLELYSMDRLPDPEAAKVEEHLLICEECCVRLTRRDEFIQVLRAALRRIATRRASSTAGK